MTGLLNLLDAAVLDAALGFTRDAQEPGNLAQAEGIRILERAQELAARSDALLVEIEAAAAAGELDRAFALAEERQAVIDERGRLSERIGRIAQGQGRGQPGRA
jgi:hypothetical protein